jgi:4-amino-4-deoxy-L-arabinose transferase-like glycosyltransferase
VPSSAPPLRPPVRGALDAPWVAALGLALLAALRFSWRTGEPLTGDSVRYAIVARDMLESGDWFHPLHGGEPYFHKPPLVPWLGALSMALFGKGVAAVSLPSALAGIGVVLAAWRVASRYGGPVAGLLAGLGLVLTPSFARVTGTFRMDSLLLLSSVGALAAFERARTRPAWHAAGWALVAVGVLAKGTPGLYPLAILAAASLLTRDGRPFTDRRFWLAAPAFLLLLAPWYVHMTSTYGRSFWGVHLGREVGDRFALSAAGRTTAEFLWESLRFPALLAPLGALGAFLAWRDGRADPALRRAAALGIAWSAGVFLGQAFNLNGFARHMYSTFVALAAFSGYGLARLLRGRVRPAWVAAPLLAAGVGWLGLRVARVPEVGVPRASEQAAVLDAVDREVPHDPVLVFARRENEASDFLRFHRDRASVRLTAPELEARLAGPRTEPLRVLVDDAGRRDAESRKARFLAKADTFSLVEYP